MPDGHLTTASLKEKKEICRQKPRSLLCMLFSRTLICLTKGVVYFQITLLEKLGRPDIYRITRFRRHPNVGNDYQLNMHEKNALFCNIANPRLVIIV